MSIVSIDTFTTYIRNETNGADATILQSYLDGATEALSDACGREWVLAGSASARLFPPSATDLLIIHDCTTVTAVVHNGTTLIAGTDYRAEPLNGRSSSGAIPYYQLRRARRSWYSSTPLGTISVTGTWGWAAYPNMITQACLTIGKELVNNQDVRFGIASIGEASAFITKDNKFVRSAVAAYSHPNSIGIA